MAAARGLFYCVLIFLPIFALKMQLKAQGLEVVQLTSDGALKQRPVFSPDGQRLLYARHMKETIQLFVRDMRDGSEQRLNPDNGNPEFDGVFSPDGNHVAFSYDHSTPNQGDIDVHLIAWGERKSEAIFANLKGLSHEEWPSWSPDGQRIAFTTTVDGNQELYVADASGENRVRLTSDPAIDAHPAWSPDGRRIAFSTNRWGDLEIALISPDGSQLQRLTEAPGLDDYPAWSPDGGSLVFTSNRDGNQEIYRMQADGRRPRNMTQTESMETFPSFHHDGRLTFVSDRTGGFEVYLTVGDQK